MTFQPDGEILHLMDRISDGHQARAEVRVLTPTSPDYDVFYSSFDSSFNLGTPDGTGDIAEGRTVLFRVCVGDTNRCSPWAEGTA